MKREEKDGVFFLLLLFFFYLCTNLITTLSNLNMNNFSHFSLFFPSTKQHPMGKACEKQRGKKKDGYSRKYSVFEYLCYFKYIL